MHLHGMRNNFCTAHFTVEISLSFQKSFPRQEDSGDGACCLLRRRRKPAACGIGLVLVQLIEDAEELAQCDPRSVLVEDTEVVEDPTRRAQISMVT
jgi:hypothetical protein